MHAASPVSRRAASCNDLPFVCEWIIPFRETFKNGKSALLRSSTPFHLTVQAMAQSDFISGQAPAPWQPYAGPAKLVIAIDLGTTFSGASYVVLQPGQKPVIEDVKAFPGQSTSGSKVPSVILYNSKGKACLFGAEAVSGGPSEQLLDEGGQLAKWWKVHLKPDHLDVRMGLDTVHDSSNIEDVDKYQDLPFGLTAERICSDFLKYMVTCVGAYLRSRNSNGMEILAQLAPTASYILTIPNG